MRIGTNSAIRLLNKLGSHMYSCYNPANDGQLWLGTQLSLRTVVVMEHGLSVD